MNEPRPGGNQIDLFAVLPSELPGGAVAPDEVIAASSPAVVAQLSAERHDAVSADGKDPGAFRTIGEVAQALGIRQHVLRYWEEQFPMLRPVKRSGARRYYRPEDVALVETINRLVHHEGYTLRGARQQLEAEARAARPVVRGKAVAKPAPPMPSAAPNMVSQLRAIRATLAEALQAS
jgi:DNA-binding transcriptional MerR regulator